ncbi:MAG: DUF1553 domain-containing protein [Pirellulaceae bacterium]|nr:DUF1553 domain-containing protein [Pirellulaceae bacterium]
MTGRIPPAAWVLLLLGPAVAIAAPPTSAEMAARVDSMLAERWAQEGLEPAPAASDAEFLRRAWLDLCGMIPPINDGDEVSGIRDFLSSTAPDKRARLIEALLARPTHAAHLANLWKNVMLPADSNVLRFGGDAGFESWLRGKFADNVPYDQLVSELLLATGQANQTGPALFYTALELKPEELAASTSRIFLGTQIQCAQCHDHPFDHWTRRDFWSYAAFFARLQKPAQPQQVAFQVSDAASGEVTLPESDEVIAPAFLGGGSSPDDGPASRRARLAEWLTSADNPYFARATVNRVWGLLFGRGLVDPVDDLGAHNPPSHPELLDALATYFAETGYDLRGLFRTLASTRAYQLSSRSSPGDDQRPELFARMAIKSLTAEQLYDCLSEAMRRRESPQPGQAQFGAVRVADQSRQAFLARFRAPAQGATEYEAGIPQALALMNGANIRQATDLSQSDLLKALDSPVFSTTEQRVEALFLSALSRLPNNDEREKFVEYVDSGGGRGDSRQALSDVLWALLNSAEFVLNH